MAMPISSFARVRRGGACHRSFAAQAEELNRHSPDAQAFSRYERAVDPLTGFDSGLRDERWGQQIAASSDAIGSMMVVILDDPALTARGHDFLWLWRCGGSNPFSGVGPPNSRRAMAAFPRPKMIGGQLAAA
jgi:hypothetical protein